MGKPQPRLTAAIVLVLIAAAGGAVWYTYRSAYTTTITVMHEPSPSELVRGASLGRARVHTMLDRDAEDLALELTRLGFARDPDKPDTFWRQSETAGGGYLVDELLEMTTDGVKVVAVHYIRTTDAPIKTPYLEVEFP